MQKQNKIIELNKNLPLERATLRAKSFLKMSPDFNNGYIYINCPTVSDLFIVENREIRQCTDKEWGNYFKTILYPPKIAPEGPKFHVKRLLSW